MKSVIFGKTGFHALAAGLCLAVLAASPAAAKVRRAEPVELRDPGEVVAELPIKVSRRNEVSAPVYINERGPFQFIVDTGATTSGIWQSVIHKNELTARHVETVNVAAADGLVRLRMMEFDAFRASVFALKPPRIMEYPDYYSYYRRPVSGILGADYLTRHTVVFDFPQNKIVLYPKKINLTRKLPGYFDAVPLKFVGSHKALYVGAKINGKRLTALVDTGASMTTLLTADHKRLGLSLEGGRKITMSGVNGNPVKGVVIKLPRLKVGSKVWRDVDLVVAPFAIGSKDDFTMLLGMDLMGRTPFAVDYGRKRLLLARPEKLKMVAADQTIKGSGASALGARPEALACSLPETARAGLACIK